MDGLPHPNCYISPSPLVGHRTVTHLNPHALWPTSLISQLPLTRTTIAAAPLHCATFSQNPTLHSKAAHTLRAIMADAKTKFQTSKLLMIPFEIPTQILHDLVSLLNAKEVAIITAGSYGVVNRKTVKSRSANMSGAILSCHQINEEIKLYVLFTKIVAQVYYDCTHVRPMEVPTSYCSTVKHLTVNDLWMIEKPALLERLPQLERLHFFDDDYKIDLMTTISLAWAITDGTDGLGKGMQVSGIMATSHAGRSRTYPRSDGFCNDLLQRFHNGKRYRTPSLTESADIRDAEVCR